MTMLKCRISFSSSNPLCCSSIRHLNGLFYPVHGMHEAWTSVKEEIERLGGIVHTDCTATVKADKNRIVEVHADGEVYEPSEVVWTGPITQICKQLDLQSPELSYLGLLLFNVMVKEDAPRDYQWCYYGASDLVFNRISTLGFVTSNLPSGWRGIPL